MLGPPGAYDINKLRELEYIVGHKFINMTL